MHKEKQVGTRTLKKSTQSPIEIQKSQCTHQQNVGLILAYRINKNSSQHHLLMLRRSSVFLAFLATAFAASAQSPITLQDLNGREVTLASPVQKTVTLPMPAGAAFATVAKGTQSLAGMHEASHRNLTTMLLSEIFPGMKQVRYDITRGSGFVPNVETLLELQPDLVWQWGQMGQELIAPIEAAGLKVAALRYGTEAQTQRWIELFAQSIGQPERATQINAWRNMVRTKVKAQVDQIPSAQRQKVMYLSRYKTGMAAAGQSGNFHDDVQIAGGSNVNTSKASAPTINIEQILMWNPDVIVLSNFEHDLTPEKILRDPMLSSVAAVRNQRVYKAPAGGYYWDAPSQDSPLYWMWLAKVMYPHQVQLDLRNEVRSAYQTLYGFDITEAQIDQALHMPMNRASRDYMASFASATTTATR